MFRALLTILICIPFFCQSQSLTIKNGETTKTFPADTYYEFVFGEDDEEICCYSNISGKITRLYADSIQIRINTINLNNSDLDFLMGVGGNIYEQNLQYTLPKSELLSLKAYKDKKQSDRNSSWFGFGGALILTGLVTLANSYDIGDKKFRDGVLVVGGAQLVVGISVLSITKKKKYKFTEDWSF